MFVIEFESNSIVNGGRVGWVYVLHCPRIAKDVYSYTKKIGEATRFATEVVAQATLTGKPWPKARIIPVSGFEA